MISITEFWPQLAEGIQATLTITLAAFSLGAVGAIPVVALRRSRLRAFQVLGASYVEILRAIPPLPWLFLVYFGLPEFGLRFSAMEAGIIVFGLIAAAYLTEIYRAGFRAVPIGQREAADALGLNWTQAYIRVLVPQAVRTMVPPAVAYLIGLLKDSAIVSVIGVLDITGLAVIETQKTARGLEVFLSAAALYLLLSVPLALLGRAVSKRLQQSATPRVRV